MALENGKGRIAAQTGFGKSKKNKEKVRD